ncbi:MAG: hypothetical protein ACYYKD_03365 [Rhodospirillales bacterium]
MKVSDYLKTAYQTDRLPKGQVRDNLNPRLGLAGEIGYLLTALKKEVRRDAPTAEATKETVKDELGDIVWYSITVAKRAELNFQRDVLLGNLKRIQTNYTDDNQPPAPLLSKVLKPGGEVSKAIAKGLKSVETFGGYQKLAVKTSRYKEGDALAPYLVQAWNNVGDLLAPFGWTGGSKKRAAESKNGVAKALGDIMWYVAGFAHIYGLNLNDIMTANVEKIISAFPSAEQMASTPLYDEGRSSLEQIPRKFNVDVVPQGKDNKVSVMLINGVRVGDPLTDNSYEIDGYRFHDAIHWGFAAVLGWSPVMRGLMKRKRKSDKRLDEVDDGARAQVVEEAIVKIVHSYAVGTDKNKLLDGKKYVNLNLLKEIVMLAEGLEVAGGRPDAPACKFWEWQKAILEGFAVYNLLRKHKRGRIVVDLMEREIAFQKHTAKDIKSLGV